MVRSPGFGSVNTDEIALFRLAFAVAAAMIALTYQCLQLAGSFFNRHAVIR